METAVLYLRNLAGELDVVGRIDRTLEQTVGRVQERDGLTVGQTLLAGIIGRAFAPRSKRAFARWAQSTLLPELMDFSAPAPTSQHFWERMPAVPVPALATKVSGSLPKRSGRDEPGTANDGGSDQTKISQDLWSPVSALGDVL